VERKCFGGEGISLDFFLPPSHGEPNLGLRAPGPGPLIGFLEHSHTLFRQKKRVGATIRYFRELALSMFSIKGNKEFRATRQLIVDRYKEAMLRMTY
jgi:hypothetical protein